jgi:MvaI/BcnI restriction endonuclease family
MNTEIFVSENNKKKMEIIRIFHENVRNIEINLENYSSGHDGKEGHWLESKMGLNRNSKNEPDMYGFELKKSSSKITLGDFSASEYLFSKTRITLDKENQFDCEFKLDRRDFIRYFGTPNLAKNNRYSWSGKCVPTYGVWNTCGQTLSVSDNNDICVYYSFSLDGRVEKHSFPNCLKKDNIMIAIWKHEKLEKNINNKFNVNGFFMCVKNENNVYNKIKFGKPFDFICFIENIKNKNIIFDSGMYEGNNRNYSQFRANKKNFWDLLLVDEY